VHRLLRLPGLCTRVTGGGAKCTLERSKHTNTYALTHYIVNCKHIKITCTTRSRSWPTPREGQTQRNAQSTYDLAKLRDNVSSLPPHPPGSRGPRLPYRRDGRHCSTFTRLQEDVDRKRSQQKRPGRELPLRSTHNVLHGELLNSARVGVTSQCNSSNTYMQCIQQCLNASKMNVAVYHLLQLAMLALCLQHKYLLDCLHRYC